MDNSVAELFEAVQRLHDEDATVVTSVRLSSSLREAVRAAVNAGMDANPNDAMLNAVRDRLEAFVQRLALDLHYERFPEARPSLTEITTAAAQLDNNPLAHEPDLLRRAADEVVQLIASTAQCWRISKYAISDNADGVNLRVLVPVAVRVEAGWDRTAARAADINRISAAVDVDLRRPSADRAVQLRQAASVPVVDATVGQAAESAPRRPSSSQPMLTT